MRLAGALALAALALAGCETTAQKSARLERVAKLQRPRTSTQGTPLTALAAGAASRKVRVSATTLVHSSEGTAAVITVRNLTGEALRGVPVLIGVEDGAGHVLYTNNLPGLSHALVALPPLRAHASASWIDDQIQTTGAPVSVTAKLGEGRTAGASTAAISVSGQLTEQSENGGQVEGSVVNHSAATQPELVVYCLARRGGRIVAAGRAVFATLPAHGSAHFQLFLVGDPRGARLELSAPATGA